MAAWGLPTQCADPALHSPVLTGVITPPGVDADALRKLIHERFDLSLGTGPSSFGASASASAADTSRSSAAQ